MILAGGSGTRLWPLARAARPKPFLSLAGGKSLFRQTYERVLPLFGRGRVLVVTGSDLAAWVRRQAPGVPDRHVIREGIGRNTAASIALAALWIRTRHGDGVMVVLPSDHRIHPAGAFRSVLRLGIAAARSLRGLLTIGVPARSGDSGFGYIRPGRSAGPPGIRRVARFVEKPDPVMARRMAGGGGYLWNSGIFVWRATTILDQLRRHRPEILSPLAAWVRRAPRGVWTVPSGVLRRVPATPIDRAVLERSREVLVANGGFRWSDVGTWSALGAVAGGGRLGTAGIGEVLAEGSSRCVGINPGGLCAFVGVRDLVVVRSGDVVLVCHQDSTQAVRSLVARLRGSLRRFR